jgi:hypothetical protein
VKGVCRYIALRKPRGCAFLPEVHFDLLARDGVHAATLQVVITAIEHLSRLRQLVEVSSERVLQKLLRPTPTLV